MHPYHIYELATPPNYASSYPSAINNLGVLVGDTKSTTGPTRAVRWTNSQTVALLPLPKDATSSYAYDINDSGVIVGTVAIANNQRAVRWKGGTAKEISQGANLVSVALTVSNSGVIGGESDHVPCKWINDVKVGMDGLPVAAGANGYVTEITSNGQAFGELDDPVRVAAKWNPAGAFTNLTGPTDKRSGVIGANDAEIAVGYIFDGQITKAHYWSPVGDGGLATPNPGSSMAFDINKTGQAVGFVNSPTISDHACLWTGSVVTDLNALIDPTLGWTLTRATCLNDAGTIAGYGLHGGSYRGWVMIHRPIRGRRPPPPIYWHVIFGVVDDSPGVIVGPQGPVPVPPWGPILRMVPDPYRGLLEDLFQKPRSRREVAKRLGTKDAKKRMRDQ